MLLLVLALLVLFGCCLTARPLINSYIYYIQSLKDIVKNEMQSKLQ